MKLGRRCQECGEMDLVAEGRLLQNKRLPVQTCPLCDGPLGPLPEGLQRVHKAMTVLKYAFLVTVATAIPLGTVGLVLEKIGSTVQREARALESEFEQTYSTPLYDASRWSGEPRGPHRGGSDRYFQHGRWVLLEDRRQEAVSVLAIVRPELVKGRNLKRQGERLVVVMDVLLGLATAARAALFIFRRKRRSLLLEELAENE